MTEQERYWRETALRLQRELTQVTQERDVLRARLIEGLAELDRRHMNLLNEAKRHLLG